MPIYILDTDHVSLFQRAHRLVRKRVLELDPGRVVTTTITLEEQLRGRLKAIRRAKDGLSTIAAYDRIRATVEFFQTIPLLSFDSSAHEWFTRFRQWRPRMFW